MERVTIIWTRPEGAEVAKVECTYATQGRRTTQLQRQAVKDTLRGMEGQ